MPIFDNMHGTFVDYLSTFRFLFKFSQAPLLLRDFTPLIPPLSSYQSAITPMPIVNQVEFDGYQHKRYSFIHIYLHKHSLWIWILRRSILICIRCIWQWFHICRSQWRPTMGENTRVIPKQANILSASNINPHCTACNPQFSFFTFP